MFEQPSRINCSIWYLFIQLSELEQCRVKKPAQGFNTAAQDSNPGLLSRESKTLSVSHLCSVAEVPLLARETFLAMHSHVHVTQKKKLETQRDITQFCEAGLYAGYIFARFGGPMDVNC